MQVDLTARSGASVRATWQLAVEVPVQILVNGQPFTVMLATPADLDDLARGLLLTEQIVGAPVDIEGVEVATFLHDVQANVIVAPGAVREERLGARTVLGNSGCGLCGIESLAQLHTRQRHRAREAVPVTDAAILRAVDALPAMQPVNASTHSVHAAAWCTLAGDVALVREDVGRHNALDKLIGALAAEHRLHEAGFVLMTSRCSYELVYKASVANTQLLATISAPTTMALQWGRAIGIPIACLGPKYPDAMVVRFPDISSGAPPLEVHQTDMQAPHAG